METFSALQGPHGDSRYKGLAMLNFDAFFVISLIQILT